MVDTQYLMNEDIEELGIHLHIFFTFSLISSRLSEFLQICINFKNLNFKKGGNKQEEVAEE